MVAARKIVVAGASGLVGSALIKSLKSRGDTVSRLVRRQSDDAEDVYWDPNAGRLDPLALDGAHAVVCLSGESIAQRWTGDKKRAILDSRKKTVGLIADTLAHVNRPPLVFVQASGVGYYGDRNDEILNEDAGLGEGFLADVCEQWEDAAAPAVQAGVRWVALRLGVVLARRDGFLPRILPIFRAGLGGRIGNGTQYMSWITLTDAVRAIVCAIDNDDFSGPVNAVAPNPVTNTEFTQALAGTLNRPALFPVPNFAVSLAMGEMGRELALSSGRAVPTKLCAAGFEFEHETIQRALSAILSSKRSGTSE